MKKLLLSSIILFLFSASILLFQVSCQKEANAGVINTNAANKIVYIKNYRPSGTLINEIWTANLDGSNQQKVNITIPSGKFIDNENVAISADGSKIIISIWDNIASSTGDIYTCNLDGTGLTRIVGNTIAGEEYTSVRAY